MGIVGCILSNAPIGGVEKIRQSKLTVQSFIECIFTMYKGFQAVSAFLPEKLHILFRKHRGFNIQPPFREI